MKYRLTAVVILVLLDACQCVQKTKCQVVRALRKQGVPKRDIRNWLCLVKHESNYHYDVVHTNSDGSKDYGIFQFNDQFWCDRPNGTPGDTCWILNTYGCADSCSSFIDENINNDANCAVRIKNCFGFDKWVAWKEKCKDVSGPEYSFCGCW